MNNRVDLILADHTFDERLIGHVTARGPHAIDQSLAHQPTVGRPVALDAYDIRAQIEQSLDQPAADQAGLWLESA